MQIPDDLKHACHIKSVNNPQKEWISLGHSHFMFNFIRLHLKPFCYFLSPLILNNSSHTHSLSSVPLHSVALSLARICTQITYIVFP